MIHLYGDLEVESIVSWASLGAIWWLSHRAAQTEPDGGVSGRFGGRVSKVLEMSVLGVPGVIWRSSRRSG